MRTDRKTAVVILGALLLMGLFYGLLALTYTYDNKYTAGPPYGEQGVLELSETDLDRPIFLIDGWELNNNEVFIGQYSNFSYLPGGTSPFGEGIYRLRLRYDGAPTTLLLELPPIFTAYTLRINGVETAADNLAVVPVGNGDTELELWTVNTSHYYSGMTYPPAIGTADVMNRLFFLRTLLYAILCITALTEALFSLKVWISHPRESLFRQFGLLCLAFSLYCMQHFAWQTFGYSKLLYAVEDTAWLLVLAQSAALAAQAANLNTGRWYRWGVRPLSLTFCAFAFISILFIIPNAGGFVKFYGPIIDGFNYAIWAWLVVCAARGVSQDPGWTSFFVLSVCGILGVGLLAGRLDANAFEPIYGAWQNEYAGFALVLLFGAVMVVRNSRLLRENTELHTAQLQYRFAKESAAQMRSSMEQVRSLKHELLHHVEAMQALHKANDDQRLAAYLEQLSAENATLPPLYYSENFLVNAIISGKLAPARANGVRISCEAPLPEELAMADADLCILLANLLDNAVEACAKLPDTADRFIDLTLTLRQDLLIITSSNAAPEHPAGDFHTTKAEADSHGLGLPAMRKVAERYAGALEVHQQGGVFTLHAVLHLGQEQAK